MYLHYYTALCYTFYMYIFDIILFMEFYILLFIT